VLSGLYYYYYILLIPLISVVFLTIYYLRLNIPIRNKRLSLFLSFLALFIVLFIVIYLILDWLIPFLSPFYESLPDGDFD